MADENKEIVIVDDKTIQEKIYFIRGQKVMLDADLAEIYGYENKKFKIYDIGFGLWSRFFHDFV